MTSVCCGEKLDYRLAEILERYRGMEGALLPVIREAQGVYGYLSEAVLEAIADHFGLPCSEVYGVATFYDCFRFKARGKNLIRVCAGTACQVTGGQRLLDFIARELEISPGETTADLKFTLSTVHCFGNCSRAPVMMVNDKVYCRLTPDKVRQILSGYK